jgi:tRNA pseudouridine55 synthase
MQLRKKSPEYANIKIGFAGRLDPLAHGVMLIMIGEETKKRDKYLGFKKEYEFEVLFGVETDSYDILGFLKDTTLKNIPTDLENKIHHFTKQKIGKSLQPFPPFSSKPVHGKPLYYWAKLGKLSEIEIPNKMIEIYSFNFLELFEISSADLQQKVYKNISLVNGFFRQEETQSIWEALFNAYPKYNFKMARFKINCSSGTYVRGLADELGKFLGCGAITTEILRVRVGEYSLDDSIHLNK